jgi:inner membrane protein
VFIGHLPASYLATSVVLDRNGVAGSQRRRLLALGLAAGIAPDFDLPYFYLVDQRRHLHHSYFPHLPAFWLAVLALSSAVLWLAHSRKASWLVLGVIGLNVTLHLVLDSVAGGIRWLWPLSHTEFRLVSVPARYHPWYLNFILHWTFGLELALVIGAVWLFLRRHRRDKTTRTPPLIPEALRGPVPQTSDTPEGPHLEFGFRGEDITYRSAGGEADISFTYIRGPRIYTDSMKGWKDGRPFTAAERREILGHTVAFVKKQRELPTIVVNVDDPLAAEWFAICEEMQGSIAGVERISDQDYRDTQKKMMMGFLKSGKGVTANGMHLRTEEDVDRFIDRMLPRRDRSKSE